MGTQPIEATDRIEQLDSLRGIAALSVVVCHHLFVFSSINVAADRGSAFPESLLFLPPIYLLWWGPSAVVLFFVLSGYVLMLPVLRGRQPGYNIYVLKRSCRIYLPYLAAVAISMIYVWLFLPLPIANLSKWFQLSWVDSPTPRDVLDHVVMLRDFPHYKFNNVIWSLVYEMRISLIFPLLAFLVMMLRWWQSLLTAVFLSAYGCYGALVNWHAHFLDAYCLTAHYAGMFVVGALLAKNGRSISLWVGSRSAIERLLIIVVGLLLYTSSCVSPQARLLGFWNHQFELLTAAGAAILITYANSASWLKIAWIAWLGRISYSLYLWHLPVALATIHLLYGSIPLALLLAISLVLGLVISWLMYHAVEKPCIRMAKRLGRPSK